MKLDGHGIAFADNYRGLGRSTFLDELFSICVKNLDIVIATLRIIFNLKIHESEFNFGSSFNLDWILDILAIWIVGRIVW